LLALAKGFAVLAAVWAAVALAAQVWAARGGGRRDYSQRAGSPWRGIVYSFTGAMLPAHKESARLHPGELALGIVTHVGIGISLFAVALAVIGPAWAGRAFVVARIPVALALLAGLGLLLKRIGSRNLRAISTPDDYLAIVATCGLLAGCVLVGVDARSQTALLLYVGLFFLYLPLGKLRHAVFFFVARGDLGRRLGYRGAYPPVRER
jgi:hypothetical protein